MQGPTELLPVSSSAHLTLVPWLGNWEWERLDPELRKSFEVALHVGAALALLVGQRRVIAEELRLFDRRKAEVLALSFLPGAAIGLALERQIERHLGGPLPTALGLLAGAGAMALADRRPQSRVRGRADAPTAWRWASPRRPRWRPGSRAQWGDPDGRPLAGVHPRARQHALTHGCPAGDRGGRR